MTVLACPHCGAEPRMDPDLFKAVEKLVAKYTGDKRAKAMAAVYGVKKSGVAGQFAALVEVYRTAIEAAVA